MVSQNPLSWNVPIVDPKSGTPTLEFMRKWGLQTQINGTIPVLSTAAEVSAVLDVIGSTRGAFLERGSTGWSLLVPGTNGYVLKSAGSGADPVWAKISDILDTISNTRGTVLYRGASGWSALAPGTSGYMLTTNGAGADPSWAVVPGGGGSAGGDYFNPPTTTGWSTVNGGSGLTPALSPALAYDAAHGLTLTTGASYTVSEWHLCAAMTNVINATTFTVTQRLRFDWPGDIQSFENTGGLCVSDGTKYLIFGYYMNPTTMVVHALPNANAGGSHTVLATFNPNSFPYMWLTDFYVRVVVSGGNYTMKMSRDGIIWCTLFGPSAIGTNLGTITTVGFGLCPFRQTSALVHEPQGMTCLYFNQTTP